MVKLEWPKSEEELKITKDEKTLSSTEDKKFLGVYLDFRLNWKKHVGYICNKSSSSFSYLLFQLTKRAGLNVGKVAFYAYVNLILWYGVVFWGNSTET